MSELQYWRLLTDISKWFLGWMFVVSKTNSSLKWTWCLSDVLCIFTLNHFEKQEDNDIQLVAIQNFFHMSISGWNAMSSTIITLYKTRFISLFVIYWKLFSSSTAFLLKVLNILKIEAIYINDILVLFPFSFIMQNNVFVLLKVVWMLFKAYIVIFSLWIF